MLVSWRWISEWVDTAGVDAVAFANRFTCTVAEIDHVVQVGLGLEGVLVADVETVVPHPNADKLRLATVNLGHSRVTVVCGAPDLAVGMRVPFVPPGVTLPSGITVRDGEVRGVPSPGMLASEADLGLSDDHSGLLSLDGCTAAAGTRFIDAVAVTDVLYDVDNKAITHRPDLWGQYGMAREVAAMLDRPLAALALDVALGQGVPLALDVAADAHCPRYVCARVEGVRVAPSPVDLRLRLRRCGVRPISNVVDATNLVMLETGNPLHAFDARSLRGQAIRVRRAAADEVITTLDGTLRALQPSDCVIADGVGPVALAGIMGGADSEIRADTQVLVLEAAAFHAPAIRKTATRLGMRTESSARFEKGLDPELPPVAARRFLRLVLALCPQARVTSDLLDSGPHHAAAHLPVVLHTSATYLRERLGVTAAELDDGWLDRCLQRLHFTVERAGDALAVMVPSFRAGRDIGIAEDLVEELGRHHGYQRVRSQAPLIPARPAYTPPLRLLERATRNVLVHGAGLTEVLTYGFDDQAARQRLGLHEHDLPREQVRNAIAADLTFLRRNLAPNLIAAAERNLQYGDGRELPKKGLQIGLFEMGRVFVPVPDRALTPAEQDTLDWGTPDALRDPTRAGAYLDGLDAQARQDAVQAREQARPLPWQPTRLGLCLAERLGGGAEGMKASQPSAEVTQRLFGEAVRAVQRVVATQGPHRVELEKAQALPAAWQGWRDTPVAPPDALATWWHPQRHGVLVVAGHAIGIVSALHPRVRQALAVPAELVLAELDLDAVLRLPLRRPALRPLAQFPATTFDLSLAIAATTKVREVHAALVGHGAEIQAPVEAIDLLHVAADATAHPASARATTWRVTCRLPERTMTMAETTDISASFQDLVARLAQRQVG